jgi:hypothetical protein
MRFRLRALLIVLALGPPILAGAWVVFQRHVAEPPVVYWEPAVIISGPVCDWREPPGGAN